MVKVDIFSGFLGAGKTTLIRKLIEEAYQGEQVVLIENEFGEIGIDKGFLQNTGIQIDQMNAGCICCTLVGDFGRALNEVIEKYDPDRILIEPSGVGKLSDVIIAVQDLKNDKIQLNGFTTVIDAKKAKMYLKNFGEFYENQVQNASSLILSHTTGLSQKKLDECIELLRGLNTEANIVATPWEEISGKQILETMESKKTLSAELDKLRQEAYAEQAEHEAEEAEEAEHHHHDDDNDDGEHEHHHHGEHDHDEHDHDHDEHDHDHHEHHHHHHHHHGHDADEVFDEFGLETTHKFTREQLQNALEEIQDEDACGQVLRSKGYVEAEDGSWLEFDYVPGEPDVREGSPQTIGQICVIGVGLDRHHIEELFGLAE
ncbi:MAG: GTP-binding protein [Eubacteriales bacterium]|nr:GTP-binding protein [Eubacteriales bacterium]